MDDDGYTLVELLVVIVLLGVVGGIVSDLMIGGLKQQTAITARISTVNDLRTVMERVSREVRNSTDREGATATSLTLTQPTSSGTRTLTYAVRPLAGGPAVVLDETDYTTGGPAVGTVKPTVVILSGVPDGAAPLFSYGSQDGYLAPAGSGIDPTTCAIAGTTPVAYSRACLGTVTITLTTQIASGGPTLTLNDVVDLRNLS